jgi:hypothetical protein
MPPYYRMREHKNLFKSFQNRRCTTTVFVLSMCKLCIMLNEDLHYRVHKQISSQCFRQIEKVVPKPMIGPGDTMYKKKAGEFKLKSLRHHLETAKHGNFIVQKINLHTVSSCSGYHNIIIINCKILYTPLTFFFFIFF